MSIISRLGPGLLYAGAAIGVSHLVQSTRAGALFGIDLIAAVLVIHVLKYGFFKAASLYPQKHGKDLVHGYKALSPWALVLFLGMTVLTAHIVIAAITLVSTGLLANLLGIPISVPMLAALLLTVTTAVLWYSNADKLSSWLKWVVLSLSAATLLCVVLRGPEILALFSPEAIGQFQWSTPKNFLFLIAFLGWMPAPMDITVWQSCWIVQGKTNETSLKAQNQDFNIGYWGTAIMAILFIFLGAVVFNGANTVLTDSPIGFASQFLSMYANSLGEWVYPVVAFAALATMISTLLTCLDAYPLSAARSIQELSAANFPFTRYRRVALLVTAIGAWLVIYFFGSSLSRLVDFVTTVSFVLAPVIGFFNYRIALHHLPWNWVKITSIIGLIALTTLAVAVVWMQ